MRQSLTLSLLLYRIWLCFFLLALQSSIGNTIIQTAYSHFAAAPQASTAQILSNVIGGVFKLPIAKLLNIWGRAEGLALFIVVYLVGIIILASCNGPNVFAAGYTIYWIGYDALYLILDLFIADTFGLRNRAFAFGFASTPFIVTAFTGPLAAQSFVNHSAWRWAYGSFAIVIPAGFLPLILVFKYYQRKAEERGVYRRRPSGRTVGESVIHYIQEFDCKYYLEIFYAVQARVLTPHRSGRRDPAYSRVHPAPSSIQPRNLRSNAVQITRVYQHDCRWVCFVLCLRRVGKVL